VPPSCGERDEGEDVLAGRLWARIMGCEVEGVFAERERRWLRLYGERLRGRGWTRECAYGRSTCPAEVVVDGEVEGRGYSGAVVRRTVSGRARRMGSECVVVVEGVEEGADCAEGGRLSEEEEEGCARSMTSRVDRFVLVICSRPSTARPRRSSSAWMIVKSESGITLEIIVVPELLCNSRPEQSRTRWVGAGQQEEGRFWGKGPQDPDARTGQ